MKKCIFDIPKEALEDVVMVAIDTETMGLNLDRDRLCVIQMNILYTNQKEEIYIIHFPEATYSKSNNLKKLLKDKKIVKILHFARFDLLAIRKYLKITCQNARCTKIMSRMARTYTDRHGLVDVIRDLLGIQLNKNMQCSDWGQKTLNEQQYSYAANDVKYLFKVYQYLVTQLKRDGKFELFELICHTLPTLTEIENAHLNPIQLLAFDVHSGKY